MTEPKLRRRSVLPETLQPIGLSREEAAAFICVSPSKFDEMVRDWRMPKPKRIDARRVWDRRQVEKAFAKLPGGDEELNEHDPWADVS
ncbi:MAG: helix-turn-helix transcriptional regulator [Devosia sp.]